MVSEQTGFARDPVISVIMPVYNHRLFVGEAIKSVLAQTYRPIEFIIIDDGSTDGSVGAIEELLAQHPAPEGIRILFSARENRGAATTINQGIDLATGTYLTILNSDDLYLPQRLECCVRAAKHHAAALVFSYVEPIAEDGTPLDLDHPWRAWYYDAVLQELNSAPSLSFVLLTHNIAVSTGNLLFHRKLVDEIGRFENYRYAHDLDFLLRASLIEEPVLVREKLYQYRVHGRNTIATSEVDVGAERAAIIYNYLIATTSHQVKNPLAPSFENWPNSMTNLVSSTARVSMRGVDSVFMCGFDKFVESLSPWPSSKAEHGPITVKRIPRNRITIISHELSFTGAPVLAFEISKTLRLAGARVKMITMRDGPLRHFIAQFGIPVIIIQKRRLSIRFGVRLTFTFLVPQIWTKPNKEIATSQLVTRMAAGEGRKMIKNQVVSVLDEAMRARARFRDANLIIKIRSFFRQLSRFTIFLVTKIHKPARDFAVALVHWASFAVLDRRRSDATLLINSFASFPLAFRILPHWRGPVFWYIHETFDPQIFLGGSRARRRLEHLGRLNKIKFLYGSEATRRVWAREGFDGQVLYWSGLSSQSAERSAEQRDNGSGSGTTRRQTILSVGTSGTRKGTRALVEAFALGIKEQLIPADAELLIVGVLLPSEDPQSRDLVLRTIRSDLLGRVRLIGNLEPAALAAFYQQADIYVQSSIMECLPLALLTAMAHGLPIVTTDVDGCKEAIINEVCGLTVPPRQLDRMAAAIGELLRSSKKARELGEAARKRFREKFSLEITAESMMKTMFTTSD